jgi:plastocyanin
MLRRALVALILVVAALPVPAAAATVRVGVVEDKANDRWGFRPGDLTVDIGDTVEFVNDGRETHTFEAVSGLFTSPSVDPGGTFRVTLRQPGNVAFICSLHTRMEGVVHVRAAPASAAPAPAPAAPAPAPAAPAPAPPAAAPSGPGSAAGGADYAVAGGWFYTQAGGGGGRGYAVTDEGGVRFWSELRRLGGVEAVGYPASQRFGWDGFTVQVFQRVVFQWRPEAGAVAFVNVFDRLHELGKDEALARTRQTPPPRAFDDAGQPFERVAAARLAVLAANPAIRAAYYAAGADPVQANGLPVSDVVDFGDVLVLRAQRVVLQQWKRDVPWARAGQVTLALGGDIAKEMAILPDQAALQPTAPPGPAAAGPAATQLPAVAAPLRQTAPAPVEPSSGDSSSGSSGGGY